MVVFNSTQQCHLSAKAPVAPQGGGILTNHEGHLASSAGAPRIQRSPGPPDTIQRRQHASNNGKTQDASAKRVRSPRPCAPGHVKQTRIGQLTVEGSVVCAKRKDAPQGASKDAAQAPAGMHEKNIACATKLKAVPNRDGCTTDSNATSAASGTQILSKAGRGVGQMCPSPEVLAGLGI